VSRSAAAGIKPRNWPPQFCFLVCGLRAAGFQYGAKNDEKSNSPGPDGHHLLVVTGIGFEAVGGRLCWCPDCPTAKIVISNSAYAKRMRVTPSINRRLLLGINGGVYDLHILSSDLLSTYIGTDDFANDPRLEESSVVRNITADFPAM
jgi:hypothetical protein